MLNSGARYSWLILHVGERARGSQNGAEPAQRRRGNLPKLFGEQAVGFPGGIEFPPGEIKAREHAVKHFLEGERRELQAHPYAVPQLRMLLAPLQ